MSATRSRGRKAFRSAGRIEAGSAVEQSGGARGGGPTPDWSAVEELLAVLAATQGVFATENATSNWISAYEPGRRLMVESGTQSSWVQVDHIRACWETFEARGQICRRDVLEPGRRSALMMALFEQLPGVRPEERDARYLVLARGDTGA